MWVLSGPVVMWRKNTRCTPIRRHARSPDRRGVGHPKDMAVSIGASKPIVYTTKPEDALRSEAGIAGLSPGALRATLDGLRRKMAGLSAEENGR